MSTITPLSTSTNLPSDSFSGCDLVCENWKEHRFTLIGAGSVALISLHSSIQGGLFTNPVGWTVTAALVAFTAITYLFFQLFSVPQPEDNSSLLTPPLSPTTHPITPQRVIRRSQSDPTLKTPLPTSSRMSIKPLPSHVMSPRKNSSDSVRLSGSESSSPNHTTSTTTDAQSEPPREQSASSEPNQLSSESRLGEPEGIFLLNLISYPYTGVKNAFVMNAKSAYHTCLEKVTNIWSSKTQK